jgi:hypothetical protein
MGLTMLTRPGRWWVRTVRTVGVCSALGEHTCQNRQTDVRDAQGEVLSVLARMSGVGMVRVDSRLLAVATLFAPDLIAAMLSGLPHETGG